MTWFGCDVFLVFPGGLDGDGKCPVLVAKVFGERAQAAAWLLSSGLFLLAFFFTFTRLPGFRAIQSSTNR
jgi:hypothetical protein